MPSTGFSQHAAEGTEVEEQIFSLPSPWIGQKLHAVNKFLTDSGTNVRTGTKSCQFFILVGVLDFLAPLQLHAWLPLTLKMTIAVDKPISPLDLCFTIIFNAWIFDTGTVESYPG